MLAAACRLQPQQQAADWWRAARVRYSQALARQPGPSAPPTRPLADRKRQGQVHQPK